MESGKLRYRLEIQSVTETNADGEVTEAWATDDTVWGSIEPLRGKEIFEAGQVESRATHRIRIRYYSGLTPTNRFKFGSRIFNIESVANVEERNVEIEALCVEAG